MTYARTGGVTEPNDGVNCVPAGCCPTGIKLFVGVCIVGRPVSRFLDNSWTLEVNRCCTDGSKNACSMLYGAAWRVAKGLGYKRLITYTLPEEGGASLKASNWTLIGERGGGNWNSPSRPRIDTAEYLQGQKLLWEIV